MYQVREIDYYPSLMYCPRYMDLIEEKKLNVIGLTLHGSKPLEENFRDLSKLTIKNILGLTPPESEAIDGCIIRLGKMSTPAHSDNKACKVYFKVVEFVRGEQLWYSVIQTDILTSFSAEDISSSITHTSIVHQTIPRPRISNSFYVSFIRSSSGNVRDFLHSRRFPTNTANERTFNQSRIIVFGDPIEINRLPPPFDTRYTPGHVRETCYGESLIKKFKVID